MCSFPKFYPLILTISVLDDSIERVTLFSYRFINLPSIGLCSLLFSVKQLFPPTSTGSFLWLWFQWLPAALITQDVN